MDLTAVWPVTLGVSFWAGDSGTSCLGVFFFFGGGSRFPSEVNLLSMSKARGVLFWSVGPVHTSGICFPHWCLRVCVTINQSSALWVTFLTPDSRLFYIELVFLTSCGNQKHISIRPWRGEKKSVSECGSVHLGLVSVWNISVICNRKHVLSCLPEGGKQRVDGGRWIWNMMQNFGCGVKKRDQKVNLFKWLAKWRCWLYNHPQYIFSWQ